MEKLIAISLLLVFCSMLVSCSSDTVKETASRAQSNSESNMIGESISSVSKPADYTPLNTYTKEYLQNIVCMKPRLSSGFHKTLYGFEIDYLGKTSTQNKQDQIYIQASKRLNYDEQWNSWERGETFYVDLVALNIHSVSSEWGMNDYCEECWSYRIESTRIKGIAFDSTHVYVGTTYGPDKNFGGYALICLDKETGKEVWKQETTGSVDSDLVIFESLLLFETELYGEITLYILQKNTGIVEKMIPSPFSPFVQIGDQLCYTSMSDSQLYLNTFSLQDQTIHSYFWEDLSGVEWKDQLKLIKMDSQIGLALLLWDEGNPAAISPEKKTVSSSIQLYCFDVDKKRPAWNATIETKYLVSHLKDWKYTNHNLYIATWGANGCIAFDTNERTVKWTTWIEDYAIEQISLYKNDILITIAPFTQGRDYVKHAQQVLELNPDTGEINAVSSESRYSGVARIVGMYRDNLITQGPDAAFLEFYPISD